MASHPTPATIGERLGLAIELEGRTNNAVEQALKISRGHVGRMVRGERWTQTVDIDQAQRIADFLHVNTAWLLLGEGPMRRGGRDETPAEAAIVFARRAGAREDAIAAAWEKHREREGEMTTWDWTDAINQEARRLHESNVPRPEATHAQQMAVRRTGQRKRQLDAKVATRSRSTAAAPAPFSSTKLQPTGTGTKKR